MLPSKPSLMQSQFAHDTLGAADEDDPQGLRPRQGRNGRAQKDRVPTEEVNDDDIDDDINDLMSKDENLAASLEQMNACISRLARDLD